MHTKIVLDYDSRRVSVSRTRRRCFFPLNFFDRLQHERIGCSGEVRVALSSVRGVGGFPFVLLDRRRAERVPLKGRVDAALQAGV